MITNLNIENFDVNINVIKMFFTGIFVYYIMMKFLKIRKNKKTIIFCLFTFVVAIAVSIIRYKINHFISIILFIFLESLCFSIIEKQKFGYTILITIISYSVNYILLFLGILVSYVINLIFPIQNDYVNLAIILFIQLMLLINILKIRRIQKGIAFLQHGINNDFLDILVLNISVIISFSSIIFVREDRNSLLTRKLGLCFVIYAIMMFITIQKSIQLYYKQKLMIKTLEETKSDLEKAVEEIRKLERENIELSKMNHSFKHQYKALKHKVDELVLEDKTLEEADLKVGLDGLARDIYVAPKNTELSKIGIMKIDDMLDFMRSECDKYDISFNLQVVGNVFYMINHFISKDELVILLADHIRDAIIAVNHCESVNKSILIKLGKLDDFYGIFIYDSGIEFEKDILDNLGKKPVTSHKDEGGSGMGFMNTFDTLKKNNATLIIQELGAPSKDNYTKIIKIIFNNKCEFKVESYRKEENRI